MSTVYVYANQKFGWPEFVQMANLDAWNEKFLHHQSNPTLLKPQEMIVLEKFSELLCQLPSVRLRDRSGTVHTYAGVYYVRGFAHTLNHSPYFGIPKNNAVDQWAGPIVEQLLALQHLDKILKKVGFSWKRGDLTRSLKLIESVANDPGMVRPYLANEVEEQRAQSQSFALYFPRRNVYYTGKHRNTPLISGAMLFENVQAALHSAKLRQITNFVVVETEITATKIVDTSLLAEGSLEILENAIALQQRKRVQAALDLHPMEAANSKRKL